MQPTARFPFGWRWILFSGLAGAVSLAAGPELEEMPGLLDVGRLVPGLKVELKYSTTQNFMEQDVYQDLERCYLQKEAAWMLAKAALSLRSLRPDLQLLVYDCARPVTIQRKMWEVARGTGKQSYVANPNSPTGSIHNLGCAVDLTLADDRGKALDLGTPFDFFGKEAQPRYEFALLEAGRLNPDQLAGRLLLRLVMVQAGFLPISNEWWHFNCATPPEARRRYQKIP